MATTYKVRYKNHCTPQEQIASGGRYYLDSDCGRKLTGNAETSATLSATGILTTGRSVDSTPATGDYIAISQNFLYIKNTSSTDILVSLDDAGLAGGGSSNGNYFILLSEGESFASEINTSSYVYAKTASGTSTIDFFVNT
tara:strand:- start:2538 stop:2960 length:423 start_codon:yes stop_codon:yes gene_type:complete